jgi:hypothetical protein
MSFIKRLKNDLNDSMKHRDMRSKAHVDASALRELIDRFEDMDATERALNYEARYLEVNHQLHNLIVASYNKQGKNAETTLMLIMDTLRPLMKEREKENEIKYRFN